jgi:hypothetical protein
VEHRTDSLSSAVNNMSNQEEFTRRYEALLKHYRLEGEHIQPRKANENGDVEQSHHRFKRNLNQALLLRGNRDFGSETVYQSFLREYFEGANRGRRKRLAEEVNVLRELPKRRLEAMKREWVRVDTGSLIAVDRNVYSVHSRLIGEQVEARLYVDRVEVWYGQKKTCGFWNWRQGRRGEGGGSTRPGRGCNALRQPGDIGTDSGRAADGVSGDQSEDRSSAVELF